MPPFRTLYKASGGYTLPYDVQVSGSFQAGPGADIDANYTYQQRPLPACRSPAASSRTVNLIDPNTMFYDYQTQVDARVSRAFRFGRRRVQAYVDVFNLLNASRVASVNQTLPPARHRTGCGRWW